MFGGHRQRIERLEAVVAVMAGNQRQFAEAIKAIVEGANENARNSNASFDAILDALRVMSDSDQSPGRVSVHGLVSDAENCPRWQYRHEGD